MRTHSISSGILLSLALIATPSLAQQAARAESKAASAQLAIKEMEQEQRRLLEEIRAEFAAVPKPPEQRKNESQELRRQRQKYEEMRRLLNDVEARINAEARMRTLYFYSSSNLDPNPVAQTYHDRLMKRIEDHGTGKFPKQDDRPAYGKVTLMLTFDAKGQVPTIEVLDSTSEFLSSYSQQLVRELVPFEPFPAELARSTDLLVTPASFKFVND